MRDSISSAFFTISSASPLAFEKSNFDDQKKMPEESGKLLWMIGKLGKGKVFQSHAPCVLFVDMFLCVFFLILSIQLLPEQSKKKPGCLGFI